MRNDLKKIAMFRALHLGDMLCIIPAARAIKTAHPEASITLTGLPWQQQFVKRFHHYFDRFIEFPGWPCLPEHPYAPKTAAEFLIRMQQEKFDLVLQMHGDGVVTNAMCLLWGAQRVAGLRRSDEYCPQGTLFPVSEDDDHEVMRLLKLTDALGLPRAGVDLEFPFMSGEIEHYHYTADRLRLPKYEYICIHPGGSANRRWKPENFALVGDFLAKKGYTVVLTGSEGERELLWDVQSYMRYPVINTIGVLPEVTLGGLAALIKHASLLVCNDTDVSHLAAALQTPSVIIFSPYSDQQRWAPLNTSLHIAIPFDKAESPEYVIHTAQDQLEKHRGRKHSVPSQKK